MGKKISKILWCGNATDADGNPVLPALSPSVEKHLEGLNVGELYIHYGDKYPSIFIRTDADRIAAIGGSDLETLSRVFLRKDKEDATAYLVKFLGGLVTTVLQSPEFTTGALGSGLFLGVRDDGSSYLEVDEGVFRRRATFNELLVAYLRHVGGQIVLTPASMHCVRVEEVTLTHEPVADSTGEALADSDGEQLEAVRESEERVYRCWFESTDGERTIGNEFRAGDQVRCQTFNVKDAADGEAANRYYWRLVVGVGEDYIDLSVEDCDAGSGIPQEGDDIVQLGNRDDVTRQSAIVLSAYGEDAPYLKLYRGIDSYDLTGKEFVNFSRTEIKMVADSLVMESGQTLTEYVDGAVSAGLGGLQIGGRNLILGSGVWRKATLGCGRSICLSLGTNCGARR